MSVRTYMYICMFRIRFPTRQIAENVIMNGNIHLVLIDSQVHVQSPS